MLTMPEINSIKCLRNDKSLSINEIADIHNINWRTAKKYADDEQIPEEIGGIRKYHIIIHTSTFSYFDFPKTTLVFEDCL